MHDDLITVFRERRAVRMTPPARKREPRARLEREGLLECRTVQLEPGDAPDTDDSMPGQAGHSIRYRIARVRIGAER